MPAISLIQWSELDEGTKAALHDLYLEYIRAKEELRETASQLSAAMGMEGVYQEMLDRKPPEQQFWDPEDRTFAGRLINRDEINRRLDGKYGYRTQRIFLSSQMNALEVRQQAPFYSAKTILDEVVKKPNRLEKLFDDLERRLAEPLFI